MNSTIAGVVIARIVIVIIVIKGKQQLIISYNYDVLIADQVWDEVIVFPRLGRLDSQDGEGRSAFPVVLPVSLGILFLFFNALSDPTYNS